MHWFNATQCSKGMHKLGLELYKCKEESLADTGVEEPKIIVLSDAFLLVFEPEQKQSTAGDYCTLQFCFSLNQVLRIQRNLKKPSLVTIRWAQKEGEVECFTRFL